MTLVVATAGLSDASTGTVERVVDGDTLVIKIDGESERVRILNIDTPETKDPDEPVECLGPEASSFVKNLVPKGTKVKLTYDKDRRDKYDRLLANVELPDGRSVSEVVAGAGLGIPIAIGANDAGLAKVQLAFDLARDRSFGFFDPESECTVPAQVAKANQGMTQAQPAQSPATAEAADAAAAKLIASLATARELRLLLESPPRSLMWRAYPKSLLLVWKSTLDPRIATSERALTSVTQRATAIRASIAEAKRKAAEVARQRELEAAAARERERQAQLAREREAQRQRDLEEARSNDDDSSGSGSNPYPGYTGPRCYEPGGKVWHPC